MEAISGEFRKNGKKGPDFGFVEIWLDGLSFVKLLFDEM
jgi:hypothetical protein